MCGGECRDGRPVGAPELRNGAGAQAGRALLVAEAAYERAKAEDAAAATLVRVGGHASITTGDEVEMGPGALSYLQTKLPMSKRSSKASSHVPSQPASSGTWTRRGGTC